MRFIACIFALSIPLAAQPSGSFLLRGVTVHPVSGPDIPNASILVKDGKIAEVGAGVSAAKGTRIVDGKGLHVYPGMIDSATQVGLAEIGSVRESVDVGELGDFNPQLRAEIAVNAASEHIPVVRANGITSVITMPSGAAARGGRSAGPPGIITGQSALIHLDGWTWEEMDVRRAAAMNLAFPTIQSRPSPFAEGRAIPFAESKKAYEQRLRQTAEFFDSARHYQKAKSSHEPGFKTDLKYEAMLPVLEGKVPVMIMATRERAIRDAIQFADKQKIKIILAGPRELGKIGPELKAKNIPAILGPTLELPLNEDDPYDAEFTLPAAFYKAGVKFAFGSFNTSQSRNLPYQAAAAVPFGLPYLEALKAVTLNAAEIWGVSSQLGSIEKGKWADLMVTDGDPLETKTQIKQLYIMGKQVDLENKHTRLYQKYLNRP